MGIVETFFDDLRKNINETLRDTIKELIQQEITDKWLSKKQLAEYWGVSPRWIENRLDEIPHSETLPWRFKKSLADQWRMGELKRLEVEKMNKVSIKNYKSDNFRVGQ
ncbi:hypothetical protein [Cellulosilyticum sp. WCF-2]|uniref:hypothetical protein n=1 Tax=Cellulosilyticum sp. WCF-2 TaxID=2497860 RepID=UPI000F8D71A2|nr:hypothetical protein [Cellulosilyticum sp. WCF-2]QEH68706.1 hypothetical protein EKH84_10075 [Cellulosilyticum sp. WCF-2]